MSSREKTVKRKQGSPLFAAGEPMVWLTSAALTLCVFMIVGLLGLVLVSGLKTFWPQPVLKVVMENDEVYMGEVTRSETYRPNNSPAGTALHRRLVRTGNFRITQTHFKWVEDSEVKTETSPDWAVVMERLEWGRFYGFPKAFVIKQPLPESGVISSERRRELLAEQLGSFKPAAGGRAAVMVKVFRDGAYRYEFAEKIEADGAGELIGVVELFDGPGKAWPAFLAAHPGVRTEWRRRRQLEKVDTGEVNEIQEHSRLAVKEYELHLGDVAKRSGTDSEAYRKALNVFESIQAKHREKEEWAKKEFDRIRVEINEIDGKNGNYGLLMETVGYGRTVPQQVLMRLDEIVRAYPANQLALSGKLGVYAQRWKEFLIDEPREANSEGGVFPAIFGTVTMTILMALAVVPFGVLAALYLREYAKAGPVVSAVRIAVNNLAGVPSIVFGVFGLGFFCYGVGGFIDGGPAWTMPEPLWFIILGVLAVAGTGGFFAFLAGSASPGQRPTRRQMTFRHISLTLWLISAILVVMLVTTTPFFHGFYRALLPNPTFGKGALIWASLTLALMTLPVVIVATEEALSSVPNSMREGSYACGASKWQTIKRIVLPRAMPGIMTGTILAMARGAGEVAPLMLVGAVKLAPELPFSLIPPFGLNRSFMHLGFHIYDVGFQSQNSEAAKPMVFTTTLLLILIVASLNIAAIWLRTRLKRKFVSSQF